MTGDRDAEPGSVRPPNGNLDTGGAYSARVDNNRHGGRDNIPDPGDPCRIVRRATSPLAPASYLVAVHPASGIRPEARVGMAARLNQPVAQAPAMAWCGVSVRS